MQLQRRTFLYGSAAATALVSMTRPGLAQDDALRLRLDDALSAPVQRGDVPMAVGGITDANDVLYIGAFGERALGSGVPVTEDSVFNMASMTKAITGAAAMKLVEQGKLDLDSPVSTWIPDAANLQVLEGFDDAGKPVLRPAASEITLRQLMTHSTGMAYTLWDADLQRYADTMGGTLALLDYAKPRRGCSRSSSTREPAGNTASTSTGSAG